MTRHWIITDSDGSKQRSVTRAQYLDEVERAKDTANKVQLGFIESRVNRHPCHWSDRLAPLTLDHAAKALANI
jgi:hypothetical protein